MHDRAVNEAYDAAGRTWSFYKDVLRRDSIDAHGLHLISSVHFDTHYDNAFWNGAEMARTNHSRSKWPRVPSRLTSR